MHRKRDAPRPDPLVSFMGDLLLQHVQQQQNDSSPLSFQLIVDNAHIHPEDSAFQFLPRPSSCPDIFGTFQQRRNNNTMPRVSSTGSLACRWDSACASDSSGLGKIARRIEDDDDDDDETTHPDSSYYDEEDEEFGDFVLLVEDSTDSSRALPPSLDWTSSMASGRTW